MFNSTLEGLGWHGYADAKPSESIQKHELPGLAVSGIHHMLRGVRRISLICPIGRSCGVQLVHDVHSPPFLQSALLCCGRHVGYVDMLVSSFTS